MKLKLQLGTLAAVAAIAFAACSGGSTPSPSAAAIRRAGGVRRGASASTVRQDPGRASPAA